MEDKIQTILILLVILYIALILYNKNHRYEISNFSSKEYDDKFLKKAKEVHDSNAKYNIRKTEIYNLAKKKATETKKKLMIIGDPYSG